MILFPNAKINIGLKITRKRPDGYHDIDTVMVPVDWCDVLEITPVADGPTTLQTFGRPVECPPEKNLVIKAYNALAAFTGGLPPVKFNLEKIIPDGAGMGGGSADAAFAIRGLNELFNLGLDNAALAAVAARVGADCPFFIYNCVAHCTGTGTDIATGIDIDLSKYTILIAKPQVASVSTATAYAGVKPQPSAVDLCRALQQSPQSWAAAGVNNDFEQSILSLLPAIADVKRRMSDCGAIYASMTGSGAAVFGIFDNDKLAEAAAGQFPDCDSRLCRALC